MLCEFDDIDKHEINFNPFEMFLKNFSLILNFLFDPMKIETRAIIENNDTYILNWRITIVLEVFIANK